MKKFKKLLQIFICMFMLFAAGASCGLFVFYYWFAHSYSQACVWLVAMFFCAFVFKTISYEVNNAQRDREALIKSLQSANSKIGELIEENYNLKTQLSSKN